MLSERHNSSIFQGKSFNDLSKELGWDHRDYCQTFIEIDCLLSAAVAANSVPR